MKRYTFPTTYRGQQIFKVAFAKSDKEASIIFNESLYRIKNYCGKQVMELSFEGIKGYFDSGQLWNMYKDRIRELMPIDELQKLIDDFQEKKHIDYLNEITN